MPIYQFAVSTTASRTTLQRMQPLLGCNDLLTSFLEVIGNQARPHGSRFGLSP
jgi:hypothetical protein